MGLPPSYSEILASRFKRAFGEGLFGDDDSDHGRHRRALSDILSIARAIMDRLEWESVPSTSLHLLPEWEVVLGLTAAPAEWSIEQRQARITARCRESGGNSRKTVKAVFDLITGGDCTVVEWKTYPATRPATLDDRNRFSLTVLVPQSAYDDSRIWADCQLARFRLRPAHGAIYVAITNDGETELRPQFRCGESLLGRDTFGLNP
jgi:hypothetical protein